MSLKEFYENISLAYAISYACIGPIALILSLVLLCAKQYQQERNNREKFVSMVILLIFSIVILLFGGLQTAMYYELLDYEALDPNYYFFTTLRGLYFWAMCTSVLLFSFRYHEMSKTLKDLFSKMKLKLLYIQNQNKKKEQMLI